jgi:NIPSNAP
VLPMQFSRPSCLARRALLSLVALMASMGSSQLFAAGDGAGVVHQLRIYELYDETKAAFHERFRDHAERIMGRYDFHIVAMWEARTGDGPEFVYLLEWPDEATMKKRWAEFMADQEWSDIKAETSRIHGDFVGGIEDRTLVLTDYSPGTSLLNEGH